MSDLLSIVSGWTGILGPFTLKIDGAALDLTGLTVTVVLRGPSGTITPGGTVTLLNQVTNKGQVTYSPISTDFVFSAGGNVSRQTFQIHWKVVDGSGKIVYFPNGQADEIGVYRP